MLESATAAEPDAARAIEQLKAERRASARR